MLGKNAKFDEVLNALIAPLKNLLDKKIKGVETEIADINTALADLEKGTIKVLTENVNLWELETGVYYLEGGWNYTKGLGTNGSNRHIFLIYKTSSKSVRYIHFCGDYGSDVWSRIECGYTDGDNQTEYYLIDSSNITTNIKGDVLGTKIPNCAGVRNYVEEAVDEIKYISEEVEVLTPLVEDYLTSGSKQRDVIYNAEALKEGSTYQVVLSGSKYNKTTKRFDVLRYIGNLSLYTGNQSHNTGEDFFISYYHSSDEMTIITTNASVLSLYELETNEVTTDLHTYIKDLETDFRVYVDETIGVIENGSY